MCLSVTLLMSTTDGEQVIFGGIQRIITWKLLLQAQEKMRSPCLDSSFIVSVELLGPHTAHSQKYICGVRAQSVRITDSCRPRGNRVIAFTTDNIGVHGVPYMCVCVRECDAFRPILRTGLHLSVYVGAPAGVTGDFLAPPTFCGACLLFFARRIQLSLSLADLEFGLLTK